MLVAGVRARAQIRVRARAQIRARAQGLDYG